MSRPGESQERGKHELHKHVQGRDKERERKIKVIRGEHPFVIHRYEGCKEEPGRAVSRRQGTVVPGHTMMLYTRH